MYDKDLRKEISGKKPLKGIHCSSADQAFYEMSGSIGYDYVWIDMEHAAVTMPLVLSGIIATNAGGAAAIVRVAGNNAEAVKPVLEMGPDGIVFPMVETPDDAEEIISLCKYPPVGNRGFGPLRANNYGAVSLDDYLNRSSKNIFTIVQCESQKGVKNLDQILEVEGIDCVICGPMDLSASIGKLGQWKDQEVLDLMNSIIESCKSAKIPFGISLGIDLELRDYWISRGAALVSMGNPYSIFRFAGLEFISSI